jgi:hypothetical protein
MKRWLLFLAFVVLSLTSLALHPSAQMATPPSTITPLPNVVTLTPTPVASPQPATFWGEYGRDVVVGLISLLVGGILVWILKPAFERLGGTLADALGRLLGPGRGFRRRYLATLVDEFRCLNIRGLKARVPVSVELEKVYVSLRAGLSGEVLPAAGRGLDIGVVMTRHQRLAVVGPPGCGKTTLLAFLALTYA